MSCPATTWLKANTGTVGEIKSIRDRIKDFVDEFINNYLTVNPKK